MTKPDDITAIKSISEILEPFENDDRSRIIRYVIEKFAIKGSSSAGTNFFTEPNFTKPQPHISGIFSSAKDIRTFLAEKNPTSANQLVAAVAYYYKFEAPAAEQKKTISANDVTEACRKANRERPKHPSQILINASAYGVVDKAGTGMYAINSVGENLVAVTMPLNEKKSLSDKK